MPYVICNFKYNNLSIKQYTYLYSILDYAITNLSNVSAQPVVAINCENGIPISTTFFLPYCNSTAPNLGA